MASEIGTKSIDVISTLSFQEKRSHDKRIQKVSLEVLKSLVLNRQQHGSVPYQNGFIILFTGDTHSNLEPSLASFVSDKELGGVVRRVQYLDQVRRVSNQPVLVLDAGDFLQGTAYFDQFEGEPEIRFMNLAGYDVLTVGNHDFDLGWPHLESLLHKGSFQAVCSNIYKEGEDKPCLPPYQLLEIEGRHIAIVGVMGLDAWQSISPTQRKGLEIKDPVTVFDSILPEIRPYVDLIIVLSHSGIKEDRVLAQHPLVNIIIGGHSHTLMQEQELIKSTVDKDEKTTTVFHSFRNCMLVGRLDVKFENFTFSTQSSVMYLDEQFNPSNHVESPYVEATQSILAVYQQKMEIFKTPIGECVETLPTKNKALGLVEIGETICHVFRECGEADIGVISSGAIKVGIEKGPVTLGTIYRVLAHAEPLYVLTIKGSLLFSLMQQGEERWGRARCFQYSGITINRENLAITDMSIAGKPVERDALYRIAGPSFFFEREFMDGDKQILPIYTEEIKAVEEKFSDLRLPFSNRVKAKGLGRWVQGIEQKLVVL